MNKLAVTCCVKRLVLWSQKSSLSWLTDFWQRWRDSSVMLFQHQQINDKFLNDWQLIEDIQRKKEKKDNRGFKKQLCVLHDQTAGESLHWQGYAPQWNPYLPIYTSAMRCRLGTSTEWRSLDSWTTTSLYTTSTVCSVSLLYMLCTWKSHFHSLSYIDKRSSKRFYKRGIYTDCQLYFSMYQINGIV